jgi:hypothetical protein
MQSAPRLPIARCGCGSTGQPRRKVSPGTGDIPAFGWRLTVPSTMVPVSAEPD